MQEQTEPIEEVAIEPVDEEELPEFALLVDLPPG